MINLYKKMGHEKGIRSLVDSFYDYMDTIPEALTIRKMHPRDLQDSRQKLSDFLCGWSGGPPYFTQKHGHPRLRMRHLPFRIGEQERDAWLLCMQKALQDSNYDEELCRFLYEKFSQIADFMRNLKEGE
jgi:hemoglobin